MAREKMTVTHKRDIISHLTCCDDILVIYQVIIVLGIEAAGTHDDTNDVLLDRLLHTEWHTWQTLAPDLIQDEILGKNCK